MGELDNFWDMCDGQNRMSRLYERIGAPAVRETKPTLFCGGPDLWQAAVGIVIQATHPPEHFGPWQTQASQTTEIRQGEQ